MSLKACSFDFSLHHKLLRQKRRACRNHLTGGISGNYVSTLSKYSTKKLFDSIQYRLKSAILQFEKSSIVVVNHVVSEFLTIE